MIIVTNYVNTIVTVVLDTGLLPRAPVVPIKI